MLEYCKSSSLTAEHTASASASAPVSNAAQAQAESSASKPAPPPPPPQKEVERNDDCTIFVSNLAYSAVEASIESLFSKVS